MAGVTIKKVAPPPKFTGLQFGFMFVISSHHTPRPTWSPGSNYYKDRRGKMGTCGWWKLQKQEYWLFRHDWFMFLFFQGPATSVAPAPTPARTCQALTVQLCADQPYTETALPNILGHTIQADAELSLQTFSPLIQVGCSSQLKPFLCSVYTPKCVSGRPQPPCKTLCEQARSGCESLMNRFGFQWPESLKCEAFTTESCEDVSLLFFIFEMFTRTLTC